MSAEVRAKECLAALIELYDTKQSNAEKAVAARLQKDKNMASVWQEMDKKLPRETERHFSLVIQAVVSVAAFSPPTKQRDRREGLVCARERNEEIAKAARSLAALLEKQRSTCCAKEIYEGFLADESVVPPAALRQLAEIADAAQPVAVYPWDRISINTSRKASGQDFCRTIFLRLKKMVDLGVLPGDFDLTYKSIANIANCALNLSEQPFNERSVGNAIRSIRKP